MKRTHPHDSRSAGKQLETPGNSPLKEARRIILPADLLQLRLIRRTVRRNRILEIRRIVQELVPVEKTGGRRGLIDVVDQGLRDRVDGFVVLGLTPSHRETENDEMIRDG